MDIFKSFSSAKIKHSDVVLIHGDAGVAAQYKSIEPDKKLPYLIEQIIKYFKDGGTVVVPTFSYSFTKNESYDKNKTPSEVGQFSESFRKHPDVKRSNHPIFSVASIGKYSYDFINSRIDDCFGEKTAFDILHKLDGKIISLGCHMDKAATFVHYIEQKNRVSYRYMKNFEGTIIDENKEYKLTTTYNVRDLSIKSLPEMSLFKEVAVKKGDLYDGEIGRFPFTSISAKKYMKIATRLIKNDEYSLINERFSNEV